MDRYGVVRLGLLTSLCTSAASAQVVYDNGAPAPGYLALAGYPLTEAVQAEDFALGAPTTVTGVRFYALERGGGYAGSVDWSIRADDGGRPATELLAGGLTADVTRTPTGVIRQDYYNAPQALYAFDFAPVALTPGTYWLVLHNGPPTLVDPDNSNGFLVWESTAGPRGMPGAWDAAPFDGTWEHSAALRDRSFSLVGVPEPGGAVVWLAGAAVAASRRVRRRR